MPRHLPQITDDEAKRLWQRAAELQEDAERAAAARPLATRAEDGDLSLAHVAQAAEEVGIRPDFVLVAMAERELPDADEIRREAWTARWVRGAISRVDAIEATRLVRSDAETTLEALRAVAAQPAFNLLLENTVGVADDLADRVLVYRLQGGSSQFSTTMNFADVRVLLVTLRPAPEGTHVRVRAPLFRRGVNLGAAGVAATLGGVGGTWSGWAVATLAAGALGVAAGPALLIPAGLGAVAGGALGLGGFRALYGGAVRQGQGAVGAFLGSIALEAEAGSKARLR